MTGAECKFCSAPIIEARDYQRVTGWEKKRKGGGLHGLRGRTETGEWACSGCVEKLARGISPDQGGLFG